MTITTDQAIALALEVGAAVDYHRPTNMTAYTLWEEELTALCNKVRTQTLLEAIDLARGETWSNHSAYVVLEKLRRMAEGGSE